ncbi:hypothetical protein SAMN05216374_2759 [Tardiphaga sp. OK246]|nr:hypothetical protein SAMN05216374_2759 [Tardiphaga sp. OK246]
MLQCGVEWRPTLVKRVIEPLRTSTRAAKVATDEGIGFLKGMGNPAGPVALATELVAAELARWLGLKTPPFAIVQLVDLDVPMIERGYMLHGPAFISKEIDGLTADGGDVFLSRLHNPEDISKLVVFDTWIRNADRCPPDPQNTPYNRDNLFFTPSGRKFQIVVFDHSHCFVEGTLEDELGQPHLLDDERIYGNFPEFSAYIRPDAVQAAVARLRQIDTNVVQEVLGSIPQQWGISGSIKAAWCHLICARANKVAEFIPGKLLDEPGLCLE